MSEQILQHVSKDFLVYVSCSTEVSNLSNFVVLPQVSVNNNLVYHLSGKEKVLTLDDEAQTTGFRKLSSNRASLHWKKN